MAIRPWTDEETAVLREMRERNCGWDEIGPAVNRSIQSAKERWRWINMSDALRKKKSIRINEIRRGRAGHGYIPSSSARWQGGHISTAGRPTDALIEEAKRRLNTPRTISQQLLGDPPPGYSALDRQRQIALEPVFIDRRIAQLLRKPTLAGQA